MTDPVAAFGLRGVQVDAVRARGQDVSVMAGAGSGKTRTLVARYLSLLNEGALPRAVVAVTFTEKAAREMRNRIRAGVHAWRMGDCPAEERARWEAVEADIDAARIGTIHGLCAALLRAHPAEAGVDPEFEVLDEGLAAAWKARAVEDALAWAVDEAALSPLFHAFGTSGLEDMLAGLVGRRLDAEVAFDGADWRNRWNAALLSRVRAFAESDAGRSIVDELRGLDRTGGLDDDAGPKLAEQVRGLLGRWGELEYALAQGGAPPAALALFRVRRERLLGGAGRAGRAKAAVGTLKQLYDERVHPWLGGKDSDDPLPDPELDEQLAELVPPLAALFRRAADAFRRAKDRRQALDFDDLEAGAVRLLEDPGIRARWQTQIAALLVDEFQDTNERQRQIVERLAGSAEGRTGRLFVVGDAKQSIYRFRGADVTVFRGLDRAIRARGGRPLQLDLTFRAHEPLVGALNEILCGVMGEGEDPSRPFAVPFAPLTADRRCAEDRIRPPYVEFLYGLGARAEAARPAAAGLLARRLIELKGEGLRWEEVALLFRASTGFPAYEAVLAAAGIPFVTVAGRGFYARPEIRDLLNLLGALADPWDDLAMAGALRSPAFGLSDAALYALRWPRGEAPASLWSALAGELAHLPEAERGRAQRARGILEHLIGCVERVPVAELLKRALDETLYFAVLASDETGARLRRNVEKLLADAHASGLVGIREFLEYIRTLRDAGAREGEAPAEAGGAVRLMTVHKAKGLEFPVVVIADASRAPRGETGGLVVSSELGPVPGPGEWAATPVIFRLAKWEEKEREAAEDRRVLYVAATRAREKLIVCGHQVRGIDKTWMGMLAGAAGVDLPALEASPGEWREHALPKSGQKIRALALAAEAPIPVTAVAMGLDREATPLKEAPLYRPLPVADRQPPARSPDGRSRHRRDRRYDGTVVGVLVHAALRRWRFPGDAGLDGLLRAAAIGQGLTNAAEIDARIREAKELLARLRADPRRAEIDAAQRRHEVPFSMMVGGRMVSGFIDLLYRAAGGQWQIVDFKTDALADDEEMRQLVDVDYGKQMLTYWQAVRALLGRPADTTLCFLNFRDALRWEELTV